MVEGSGSDVTSYPLKGDVLYAHKPAASTLLLSLGRQLAKLEQRGWSAEAILTYPVIDGWASMMLLQHPDDATLADRGRGVRLFEGDGEADDAG